MTTGLIYALPPAAIYYAFKRYMVRSHRRRRQDEAPRAPVEERMTRT